MGGLAASRATSRAAIRRQGLPGEQGQICHACAKTLSWSWQSLRGEQRVRWLQALHLRDVQPHVALQQAKPLQGHRQVLWAFLERECCTGLSGCWTGAGT